LSLEAACAFGAEDVKKTIGDNIISSRKQNVLAGLENEEEKGGT
jgi:hypothetical protein